MNLDTLNPMKKHTFIGPEAIQKIYQLCDELEFGKNVLLVYDKTTKGLAGDTIAKILSDYDYNVEGYAITDSNEFNVDYTEAIIKRTKRDFVIGIGGGKSIDVAKLASYNCDIPWISVPTAISHDGFASSRSSITCTNGKESKKAQSPLGLIGDTNIIFKAPSRNYYSGVMDILSNEIAVYDCMLAESKTGRKVDQEALDISFSCASEILLNPEEFKNKTQDSIAKLIELGIMSGKAMQLAGDSSPASGFEHKTSHALDQILKIPKMHGEQVGVGTLGAKAAYEMLGEKTKYSFDVTLNAFKTIGLPVCYPCLEISQKDVLEAYMMANKINPGRYTIGNLVEESGISWEKILKSRKLI
ncbi:MAG: iron-containing alcohol dehydrogenase [Nanoarchaeota archaeon]|nr:iron-containing alcohol dehydrogenase [Nanoarchaeota archaeon]MBU4123962.1 iron-containing alcohol dehydrogenase [Nanoarchaeota archaeon]